MTETTVPVAHRDSPYFGLDYYDEQFGAWFFGRESDGSKIITNLRAARLTLLHAESGVGKTSLLRAGVAWRLHRLADDMVARGRPVRSVPVVFSSWKDDPVTELTAAVDAAVGPYLGDGAVPEREDVSLGAAVKAASDVANASLLIMLDQFEEYLLYLSRGLVTGRFADELASCVNRTDLRANFLIAIREDAYAGLGDLFKGRIANIYGNYLHIDYLDRTSAEKAIREPLGVYNSQPDVSRPVALQDELVEAVLDEVRAFGGNGDAPVPVAANGSLDRIATPLLQLVMQRVWDTERVQGSRELRLSTLQQLRGVRTIVDDHLEKALNSLTRAERQTAIDTFDELITASGGKIAVSVSDLAKATHHRDEQVGSVLAKLDREFIVRPVPAAPGQQSDQSPRYEIFHDVLAPSINRAIAAREEQRHTRRIRRFAALAACLLIVVSAIAVVFALLLKQANDAKRAAESHELAAQADLNLAQDPELSTSLALQALRKAPTNGAVDALRAALPSLQTLRTLHVGPTVYMAAFDPADPAKVLSADFSGIAKTWDVHTGRSLTRFSSGGFATTGVAGAAAYNPDGTKVAVGYSDGEVAVFDARTGTKLASTKIGPVINSVAFVGDTGDLAIATERTLVLWHAKKGQACCQTLLRQNTFTVAANPRNPQELVAAAGTGVVIVNAGGSGRPAPLPDGARFASDAEFSPDGSKIVTADSDGSVDIYSATTRKVVRTLVVAGTGATAAAISPDGKQVVAGYQNGTGRVWDLATGIQRTLPAGHTATVDSARFSPDGKEIVTASADGTIRIWYTEPRELRSEFTIPAGAPPVGIGGAEYIGDRIITITMDGQVLVSTPGGQTQTVTSPGQAVNTVDWNRAGTKIVTSTPNGTVELWRAVGSGYARIPLKSPVHLNQPTGDAAMSPDGSRFAVIIDDSYTVQVGDANTGRLLQRLEAKNSLQYLAFNPSERQIVGVDQFGQVEAWDGQATNPRMLGTPGPLLSEISFNQSGSEFVTASASGAVTIWNARDERVLKAIDACPSPNTASFSPGGRMIVVACSDGTVRVFAADTGRTLTVMRATSAGIVSTAAFSPDGKSIVAGINAGNTGDIQIWNSELASSSPSALEQIAEQRVTLKLTAAQVQQYLSGGSS